MNNLLITFSDDAVISLLQDKLGTERHGAQA